jgi:transaldolase
MALDRQSEVDDLYKKAQNILLHEMTEAEQTFVSELAFDDHATLPPDKLSRLRELVEKKGNKLRSA